MLTFYMDESGFTGEDLLSPEQRIFVHVSATLSDEECAALHKEYFSGTKGPELKHKNISRRPSSQRRSEGFINAVKGLGKSTVWVRQRGVTGINILVDG